MDHDDGRVLDPRERLRLAQEAQRVVVIRAVEELERDPAVELGILGLVDRARRARAESSRHDEAPDTGVGGEVVTRRLGDDAKGALAVHGAGPYLVGAAAGEGFTAAGFQTSAAVSRGEQASGAGNAKGPCWTARSAMARR